MKIPIGGSVAVVALLLLALAGGGCESTPLLAPAGASLSLLASPETAVPDANYDPTETYYFSTVFGQMLDAGSTGGTGSTGTTTGTSAAPNSTPLVGVSVTFTVSGGNLRFNSCVQGVCSLDSTLCPGGAADCVQPSTQPLTVETDSSGVVQVLVAVTEDDPSNITVTALSGSITKSVIVANPLGVDNSEPQAAIDVSPDSPAEITPPTPSDPNTGSVSVTFVSESSDPDGDEITCYEWTISSTGPDASVDWGPDKAVLRKDYTSAQTLDVLLRVSDDPDAATSCNADTRYSPNSAILPGYLICENAAPTAAFTFTEVDQGATYEVRVDGSTSSDPEMVGIQKYQWDCNNNDPNPTGVEAVCEYDKILVPQTKEIELVVTDVSTTGCEKQSIPATESVPIPAL